MAIEAGVDTFEHGTPTPEEIDLAAKKGIAWTPTINMSQEYLKWYERQSNHPDSKIAQAAREGYTSQMQYLEQKHASMEYALKVGLKVVTGTDSFMRDVRFDAVPDEMCRLVEYGCTPMQAIQAATHWAAQSMGWTDIGTLQPGRQADLIAVKGNPLADIRTMDNAVLVVCDGRVIKYELPASQTSKIKN
jgi:imidazolonepropionase-like amidohydrolase